MLLAASRSGHEVKGDLLKKLDEFVDRAYTILDYLSDEPHSYAMM